MPSMRDMRTAPPQESSKYSINTQEAVRAMPSSIRRPNASTDFLWRKVVMIESINTANVVVLIPPAVEPADPPIIIRHMRINLPASVIFASSTVLKPAVLALTD